jgi:hypothetical protein
MNICPNRFKFIKDGYSLSIPACWNYPLDVHNEQIKRVVIVVHGVLRNADEYYPHMMEAVKAAGAAANTLVVAPQFLLEEDVTEFKLAEDVLFWGGETGEGWKKGDDSLSSMEHPRPAAVSAFEVVDRIIERAALEGSFLGLKQVTVIGHSAGGQYVNRYAAGTQISDRLPEDVQIRFIVANPSTYVYFTPQRRLPDTTDEFGVPEGANPDYDDYKYGLACLNPYMAAVGVEAIRAGYPQKDVVYLLGGEDTREAHLEQTPNAMLQGVNRLERGQVYYHYLQHTFGEGIRQTQKIAIVPCVGHDHAAIFKSKAGLRYLFS